MKPRTLFSRLQYSFGAGVLAIVFSCLQLLTAQTFPAIVSFTMSPPNSPYLSDFLQPGQERVILNVTFLDQNEPSWNVKLRMNIDGNGITLRTSQAFYQSVTLSPGPNLIDLVELEQLFDFSKMDVQGINKSELVNAGRLPEGTYTFCVEVMDAARGDQLGTAGCHTATLIQNNPPQVTTPSCGDVISAAGGQNILFNWIPMHDPSIQVRYEMKLVQVPEGMNVNDAINSTSFPILDWLEINGTSFIYGPTLLPLDLNQKYAFQLRVVDVNGLTTFENDGKAPVCWFTYGFSNDGTIDLTAPAHQARVTDPAKVDFAWSGPSNATNGQQLKYHIKVVKLGAGERVTNQGTGASYMDRTQGVWYEDSTGIMPNIYGGSLTVEQPLEADAYYAWQIKSSTDGFKTAKSEVREFRAPPVIYSFWVADGGYMVEVTNTTNYTKVNENKYTNLTGTGTIVITQGEQPTEVSFAGLTVEMIANKWVLTANEITVQKTETKELDFGDYGDGGFEVNTWVFTSMAFLAQGQVQWRFPLSVNAPGNAMVVSAENVRLNYMNRELSGAVAFAENQSYNLLIPMGFLVDFLPTSQFLIQTSGVTTLKMNGMVLAPNNVKTVSGDRYALPFVNAQNPFYMEIARQTGGEELTICGNTKMSLEPKTAVVDFSGTQSPTGLFESQPNWVGVYFKEYDIRIPTDFDDRDRLFLQQAKTLTYIFGQASYQNAWITAGGLNLNLTDDVALDATVNTFPGKLTRLRLKIENNSIDDSKIKGSIKVPFLASQRELIWEAPVVSNGIGIGTFDENHIKSFGKTFNPSDPASKLKMDINEAVFVGGNRIRMNVDLEWPKMDVKLEGLSQLNVWGDGELGFVEPDGVKDLNNQVTVKLGNMTGTAESVAAVFDGIRYSFSLMTKLDLPTNGSSPKAAITTAVANANGGEAPNMVYSRSDGQQVATKFKLAPIRFKVENGLIEADLFADYYDNDPNFQSRFEAKGDVFIKAPYPTVATARFVMAKKDGTKFWYARAAAQGLNIPLDPNFSLNGFDFRLYHHLSTPPGYAMVPPNQFNDFWNLNASIDGSSSIEGHQIDAGTPFGMYGKIGLHDTPSGKKQPKKRPDLTGVVPSIGDLLPEIPSFCDLKYRGRSICNIEPWPWEGLDLCDIHITYLEKGVVVTKSWCQANLFDVPWPTLQFCDLKLASGKKLGDFTLGQLGFSNIDVCDLKLPNGSGLCEYFDISGSLCDLKDADGPICNKKLCDLMPNLPPVCQWKIPGMKELCKFDFGDLIPDLDLCAIKDPTTGKSAFCDFNWPGALPDVPNPCDLRLPNGQKLCNIQADWCDIIVPVMRNGSIQQVPLCEVKWWEIPWPTVNVCDWKINGQSLCNLNFNFCDLKMPLTEQHPCDFIPNFCDLVDPTSGKSICEMDLFPFDWPNYNFCELKWPGTNRKICNTDFGICDFKQPNVTPATTLCNFRFGKLLPDIPNLCKVKVETSNGVYKELCDINLNINIPRICDVKMADGSSLCKIKMPELPTIPLPNLSGMPDPPALPPKTYQWLIMMGVRTEFSSNGTIQKHALDGNGWFYTTYENPNDSYLARGFGGMEIYPNQKKVDFHLEGESGTIKTPVGRIKPVCAEGEINGFFNENDWAIDVGTRSNPLTIEFGCVPELNNTGYIKARPSGIKAVGTLERTAKTSWTAELEVASVRFEAKADLEMEVEVGIDFESPTLDSRISADANAEITATFEILGEEEKVEIGGVDVSGDLSLKVDDEFCMSGKLKGTVTILEVDAEVKVGVKIANGNISFPANPSSCD